MSGNEGRGEEAGMMAGVAVLLSDVVVRVVAGGAASFPSAESVVRVVVGVDV